MNELWEKIPDIATVSGKPNIRTSEFQIVTSIAVKLNALPHAFVCKELQHQNITYCFTLLLLNWHGGCQHLTAGYRSQLVDQY